MWEKAAPPALTLIPDTSVLPCMSLVPFEVLPQSWGSEGVSPSKPMHRRYERNAWTPEALHLPQLQSLLVFTARSHGDLSSWHWNPGLGGTWCGAGTPHSSVGDLFSLDMPLDFQPPHVGVGPASSTSLPLLTVWMCLLLCILSCKTSVELEFRQFWMLVVM